MSTIIKELLSKNFTQAKSIAEKQHCTIDENYNLLHNGSTFEPIIELDNENPQYVIINVKYQISSDTIIQLNILSLNSENK
jgi:hypothetical protein